MSVQYTCSTGYSLNEADNNTCQNDGTGWKYAQPTCVECQTIFEPLNGGYMVNTDGSSTYSVFTCDAGYSLNIEEDIATCSSDGTWDQTSLDCVQCESLTAIENGLINITSGGSSSFAQYTCVAGYTLLSDGQRNCLTNGSWDGSEPLCVCNSPTAPASGHVSVSGDFMTATYTCDTGYTLNGVSQRYCGNDGAGWSDQKPICELCETLSSVTGGSVELWTEGESTFANFTCTTGFSMDGEAQIQCRSDGTWNFNVPSCTTCDSLSAVSGGTYSYSTDGETTSVTYECDVGYSMSGSPGASCSSVGSWSTAEPECVACPLLVSPDSGSVSMTTDGSVSTAVFSCTADYHVVGNVISVCGEDGSWNSTEPVCVCDTPTSVSHGSITISTDGSVAAYSCDAGYTLDGNIERVCASDGSGWNGTTPECVTCDSLTSPINGSLDIITDGVYTSATVSCDVGFTSTGDASLTCQSDGTYDSTVPSCVECDTLVAPVNGNLSLSSNSTQTAATFTCDVGYTLKGEDVSNCMPDGSWSFSAPTCETCEQFPVISSGSYSTASNGTTSYVTVHCVTGYYLDGEAVVTCLDDGTWSHTPACLCEDPETPTNGATTSSGSLAMFACDTGFSLSGASVSVCRPDGGGWLIASPSCVQCNTLNNISQGEGQISTDGSQTFITYSCPVGYTLDGDVENFCYSDGTWSSAVPSCVTCEALSNPASGTVQLDSDNTTTSAVYACASGYELVGDDIRTCLSNGTWTLEEPTCVCIDPDPPTHGNVDVTADKTLATYTCDVGYTLNGKSSRTCQTDGSAWTETGPSCSLCDTITSPSGGAVSLSTDGEVTIASFTCSAGYTMDGGSIASCRDDGSWNTSVPTCVLCDSVSVPQNGAYTFVTNGETSTAVFTCDTGFTLQGTSDLTCAVSGRYSDSEPTCLQCDTLVTPDSGVLTTTTNGTVTVATFACDTGYYLNGAAHLTCGTDGTWDGSEPECRCDPPPTIANGFYNISTDESVVTYSCLEGFTMTGERSQICQSNGLSWDSSQPLCVGCDSLATPDNSSVVISTDGSITSATVSCFVGTTLYGEPDIECTTSGTWTVSSFSCVTCEEISAPANGNITINTNGTFSTASFTCNTGFTLSGSDISTCSSDGIWSSSGPICVICPEVEDIDNGDVIVISDGLSTSVLYSCHPNYGLSGSGLLGCRTDGSWNDSVPSCVCDSPFSLVGGNYTISADGMTLTYTCDLSFTMIGSSVRTCATDSSGWSGSPPVCNECDSLPSITDGEVLISRDGTASVVTYNCYLGYSISGDYSATCDESGQWNITAPSCIQCPSVDTIANGEVTEFTDGVLTTALYECLVGYYLVGEAERECTDGAWSGSPPICLCSSSSFFDNGAVVSNGSVISYTCDSGYSLSGAPERTCQNDGSGWSLTEPSCVKCEALSVPTGGNISLSTDGSITKAAVTCLIGYTMSGTPTLTCGSDGNWDYQTPTCGVPCSALNTPSGGQVSLQTDGLTTTALYTCDTNYTVNGVSQLTCRSDGSWDFVPSTCEQCDVITSPTNGYMNITTDGATSLASFTCHKDYYLDGAGTSTCSSAGSWSDAIPSCICNAPDAISNGDVSISDDGLTATYTCTSGFTLYGSSIITCQDNYQGWSSNDTSCVSCGAFPQIPDGSVSMVTDGVQSTAEFTCNTGYSIKGETTVQCDSNGMWITSFPECVSCADLDDIANGTTLTSTDGHTTSKAYQCNIGYSLSGQSELLCLEDGSWISSPPECVICGEMSTPSSGFRDDFTDGIFSYIEYSCVSGYHLVGNSVIQCQTDGSWNGSLPSCVCDAPTVPPNAALSFSSEDTIVEYSCSTGFSLTGVMSRECSDNGLGWHGTEPSCVQCADVDGVADGINTIATNGTTSTIDFTCNTGFTLNGDSQITCDENGMWSANIPQCVSCDEIVAPASGSFVISSNGTVSTVSYNCDTGYNIVGDETRSCTANGQWTSGTPECVCDDPGKPVDGSVVSDGYKATYTCDAGYTLYGEYIRVCNNDNTGWNGTDPTCVACVSLNTPSGGSVSIQTDGQITSALFTCQTGYTISGTSTVTCRSDGTWDFTSAACVSCETLSSPDNGQVSLASVNSVTYAHFECNVGYTLNGFQQLSCRSTGSWDFSEPSCVLCEALEDVSSGDMSVITDGVVSYVYYTCAVGYTLEGDSNRTCGIDGIWSGMKPVCICDIPAVPENGSLVVSTEGNSVVFSCDVGFTMVGSATLICQTDGTGWNGTSPSCVECGTFDIPDNGSISYETNNEVTSVTVTCNIGSSLQGTAEIMCGTNGEWEIRSNIDCVSCPFLENPVNGTTTLETNGTQTKALFSCNLGTSLYGLTEIECTDEGVWSADIPVCETCTPFAAPSLSYEPIQYSSDGHTTTLTVTCVDGYHTSGSSTVTCNEGLWESSLPECVCDSLSVPLNGTASVSSDLMITFFTCDAGYTMVGETTSYCLTDGTGWNTTAPNCVMCDLLTEITSGSYNISSNGSVSVVTYTCGAGFTLSGSYERQCGTNGEWEDTKPICVSCPTLDAPSSGSVTITTDSQVSEAIYTCVAGYELSGDIVRECLANGTWSSEQPNCYCTLPTPPFNGDVAYGLDVTVAKFTCDSGYTLHGDTEGYCQDDGSGWNTSVPDCVACSTLSVSPGTSFNISTDGVTSTAVYECGVGYTIQGDTNLECRSDGTWNVQSPSCVSCETLTLTDGGSINFETDGSVTQATVTCGTGYTVTGAQTLSCKADGTWDFTAGSCVECPGIIAPDSGYNNLTSDGSVTMATFWCEQGYFLDGSSFITCETDGTWSGNIPTCKCDLPDSIVNGDFAISNDSLSVVYTCELGYSMDGANTRTCDHNGNGWTGTSPLCYKCDDLSEHYNGTVNIATDGDTTTATFACDSGYTMSGSPVVQCTQDGTWEFEQPTCTKCEEVLVPSNGSFQWVTDSTSSDAVFSCDEGYSLTGSLSLSCSSDGSVTGTVPTCVACTTLDIPNNGVVTIATNGSMTTATYECDVNYSLIGNEVITCIDGSWNNAPSYCECSAFSKPSDGNIVVSDDGMSATYSCDPGFTLSGETEQTCGSQSSITASQTAPTCNACDTLELSGVSYTFATDGTTTSATFKCETGYTMIGEATSACRSDGTWTTSVPTCETCEPLSPPTGGTINLSSDGSTTLATVVCDSGYSLNGVVNMTCRTDGSWNFGTATCVKCPDLETPDSGNLTLSTDGTVTNAIFDCMDGYYIDGQTILTCGTDGTWSGESPSCLCEPPDSVLNGLYTISNDGMTIMYECNLGYSMDGTNTRVCGSNGNGWSLQTPTCFECGDLLEQTNGSVTLNSDGVSTFATFACDTGYSMSGSSIIQCQPDGSWNVGQASCVKCSDIEQPQNGTLVLQSNGTTTSTQYSCDVGFTLSGSSEVTCSADGTWTDQTPSCVSCPSLVDLENGQVAISTDGSVTMASFTCDQDYSLYGSSILACTSSGLWNESSPECVCSTFIQPDNGDLVISENGTKATYSCAAGFTLSGDLEQTCGGQSSSGGALEASTCTTCDPLSTSPGATFELSTDGSETVAIYQCQAGYSMIGTSNLTCRTDGTWDVSPPGCETCETLPSVVGGDVEISTDGEQTQAVFACDLGFTLSGQTTLSCRTDGTWDFTQPECVSCPALADPANGQVNQSTTGQVSVAKFSCVDGYYLDGNEILTCLESGTWDNVSPTCICDPPEDLMNGAYILSNDGMSVTYTCDVNYTLNGTTIRTCSNNGNGWDGVTPTCYKCDDLSEHENGTISTETDGVSTSTTFTCAEGHSLSGSSVLQCLPDGTWDAGQPSCKKCEDIETPNNGSLTFTSNGTSTLAEYSCDVGFSVSGSVEMYCAADGTWTGDIPSCVSCPMIETLEYGDVTVTSNGSVTIATYSCVQDYSLLGDAVRTCTSSGAWESTTPTCVCSTFVEPSDGDIVISENGTQATYSCGTGFTLSGDVHQTCGVVTSVGDTVLTPPTCIMCESISTSTGVTFELSTDGSQTIATFQCPTGYTMVGTSNLTCRTDGSWDISPPTCETCATLATVSDGSVSFVTDGEQTQAVFTCDPGSTLSGPSTLSCRTDGTWDIAQPDCVTCPSLNDPVNGQVNVSTSGQVSVAQFICADGYYIFGNDTLTCLESGLWNHDSPTCRCISPPSLPNGTLLISDDGESAFYTCVTGFSLNGDNERTCKLDGTGWNGTQPVCEQCQSIPSALNQEYNLSTDGTSTTVEFTCNTGSSISGEATLTCLPDGSWSDDFPLCVECPSLMSDSGGTLSYTSNGTVTAAVFQCDEGSALVGSVQTFCETDGTWSASEPTCVQCPELASPLNGEVVMVVNGSTTWATFPCNDGYSVAGTPQIYCTTAGTWDSAIPVCECDTFTQPLNGNIVIAANNSVATVTCDEGFALSGETTLYCSDSSGSSDTSSIPSCVSCESLSTSSGSSLELSTDGVNTIATYSCDSGHVMNGERVLTCRSDGSWNHEPPMCSVCDPLDSPLGGTVQLSSDGENTTAVYTCVTGFSLVGQLELTCKSDGSWDFVQPTCECDLPPSVDNGAVTVSSDKLTSTYSCDVGYTLSGPDVRHCRTNGSWWDGTDPVCSECAALDAGVGMNVTLFGDGKATSAIFRCENGYSLSHTNNVTCLDDGSWNTAAPTCVQCASLNTTTALSYSTASDGLTTTATFTCATGYGMSGPQSVTCVRNGSWSMTQPTCFKSSDQTGQQGSGGDGGGSGATIAFGVLFGIATLVAIILAVVAWRLWRKSKSIDGPKSTPFVPGQVQFNPLFSEIDRDKVTPSTAPVGHERHVTDMGRADSSLAPRGHHKHVIDSENWLTVKSPAPLTTRNIELQRPPMMTGRRSPSMIMSATPSSLGDASLGPFLPEQILTPRDTSSAASSVLDVPKIYVEVQKPKRTDKARKKPRKPDTEQKSVKLSPFLPIKEKEKHVYREGSPLPQQILTPRNADDIVKEQEVKNSADKPTQRREKKPKGDLIDKDKNLLKIYSRKDTNSPTPGISSPQYQKLAGFEQDHEISDIEV
ncbi:CUB and sushi domain-containing protein 3-like [Mercenaria mercenaria]|uniref:CUB and sushi domain-containing protein 3-like n=1 Tax=Mercenaria mercenaria TaxID=6596 RepID=UPI00234E98FA|nr:CUB and sushi domain-containing protein 3-like [Mercenaria mercenaria]